MQSKCLILSEFCCGILPSTPLALRMSVMWCFCFSFACLLRLFSASQLTICYRTAAGCRSWMVLWRTGHLFFWLVRLISLFSSNASLCLVISRVSIKHSPLYFLNILCPILDPFTSVCVVDSQKKTVWVLVLLTFKFVCRVAFRTHPWYSNRGWQIYFFLKSGASDSTVSFSVTMVSVSD